MNARLADLPADAVVIFNHDWNGVFAWIGADDCIVRYLSGVELDALDNWALVTRLGSDAPITPSLLRRYLRVSS